MCRAKGGHRQATWLRRYRLVRLARRLRDFDDMTLGFVIDLATTEFTNNEAENNQTAKVRMRSSEVAAEPSTASNQRKLYVNPYRQ